MKVLQSILPFLLALGVLIVFHELGHYVIARWCKVRVLRFSFGFGPALWRRKYGQDGTEWMVSALPFGGYVKMLDEREGEVAPEDAHRAFNRRPIWQRMLVILAGPVANLLLAVLLLALIYMHGVEGTRTVLSAPMPGTPAAEAGLHERDEITAIGGEPVASWQDVHWKLLERAGQSDVALTLQRADDGTAERVLSLASVQGKDWDGNFLRRLGLQTYLPPQAPVIGALEPGKPAALAGLQVGDRIVRIDGTEIKAWDELVRHVNAHPDALVRFGIVREGHELEIAVRTVREVVEGQEIGRVGLRPYIDPASMAPYRVITRYGVFEALQKGTVRTWELSAFTLKMLYRIITGEASLKNISGPITMADYAGQSAQQGIWVYLSYLALISISLGVLNLLPIPILDGGHLMYHTAELIKGSPVSERVMLAGQQIGIVILFALLGLALYNDFARLLS
jgi:regulator of sigma E protease